MKLKMGLAALAAVAAVAFMPAVVAGASANANGTTLYTNNSYCHGAFDTSQPTAGFVNFHVDGTTVNLNYHVKGGRANGTEYVYGYDSFCHFDAYLGSFTTNSNGVGNADLSYTVPAGTTEVWTFGYDCNASGCTTVESLAATP
jgi:hypothetical protein